MIQRQWSRLIDFRSADPAAALSKITENLRQRFMHACSEDLCTKVHTLSFISNWEKWFPVPLGML